MTALLDPALCSELSTDQHQVLQTIYDAWNKDLQWPRTQWVDTSLDREHGLDVEKILPTIPQRYIVYNMYSPMTAELKLTVAGIACCDGSAGDVQLFMRILRWCIERERAFRPADPAKEEDLRLSAEDAKNDWTEDGFEATPRILEKAFAMAEVEQVHSGWGRGQEPLSWTMTITRRIRPYRTVQSFEDYLAIKEETHLQAAASAIPYSAPPRTAQRDLTTSSLFGDGMSPPPPFVPAPARVDYEAHDDEQEQTPVLTISDLHPLVVDACEKRFARGHFRDGVLAAILAYRDLVRERCGLIEDNDSTLMGKAFGGKPVPALLVADMSTETGRNLQRGMVQLSEGLLAFVRNPLTHESKDIDPGAAMRMIALVDMLVRQVDAAPVPAAAVASEG